MLNIQAACAQIFQTKNDFFVKNTDARLLKIQYFPFHAVLKMHNCFSICLCLFVCLIYARAYRFMRSAH